MKTKARTSEVMYTLISFSEGATPEQVIDYLNKLDPQAPVRVNAPGVMFSMGTHTAAQASQIASISLADKLRKERVQAGFIW